MAVTNLMFDELDNKAAAAGVRPAGPAPKAEDIFSEVDPSRHGFAEASKTVKPEAFRPKDSGLSPAASTIIPQDESWLKNKALVLGLSLGGLILVIGGGYLGLRLMLKTAAPANEVKKAETANGQSAAETAAPAVETNNLINQDQPIAPAVTEPVDSDLDGLTDDEEIALGTNANNLDTDQDGLTDREEARVYLTSPVMADTDGDGYPDGEEVKNGFNPKGAGKLLDINNQ